MAQSLRSFVTLTLLSLFILLQGQGLVVAQTVHQESIAPDLTGNELLEYLIIHYAPSNSLSYAAARDEMFTFVDNEDDFVICIYTGDILAIDRNESNPRNVANTANPPWNTEHIWPQSKGASQGAARSDIHHLRPIRANVNSSRSNFPFAYLEPAQVGLWWRDTTSQTNTPSGDLGEWSRRGSGLFQVRDLEKGFTARSMFYFFTFYTQQALSADPDYFSIQMDVLRSWHNNAQVTQNEVDRTNRVETIQGNVNPFIVDTTLVRRAFFEDFDPEAFGGGDGYFVDFETGSKGSYGEGEVELNGLEWTFSNALIAGQAGDERIGTASARLRHQTGSSDEPAFIRMNEDKEGGTGVITFLYSRSDFSGDRTGTAPGIVVEYSFDQGATWDQAGDAINLAGVNELTQASRPINDARDGRVRIRSISGANGKRFNIDNFRITDFTDAILPSLDPVVINSIGQTEITVTSGIASDGGGDITESGFIYSVRSQNSDPLIDDDNIEIVSSGVTSGSFTLTLTGLQPGQEYVIKPFAINQAGTNYAEEDFATTSLLPPSGGGVAFEDDFETSQGVGFTTSGSIGTSNWNVVRSGADWGARIHEGILTLTNTASSTANANGWVYAYTETNSFNAGYNPVLEVNEGLIEWSFNLRQIRTNPAGFNTNNYGVAFVIAADGDPEDIQSSSSGYAVVLGNTGTPDPVRFVSFDDGIGSLGASNSGLIVAGSPLNNPTNNHFSVRVTYNNTTNTWRMYGRNDGSSFEDPQTGELTFLGEVVDDAFTDSPLTTMGGYWQGSTAANQTAFIDNVQVQIVTETVTAQTEISGTEGWRMVSPPVQGLSFREFFEGFWIQGLPGGDTQSGSPNVVMYDFSNPSEPDYITPSDASDLVEPGTGILFYTYQLDDFETGEFPKSWEVSGDPVTTDVTLNLNPVEEGFSLIGNPFSVAIDWEQVIDANPGQITNVIYVYDHLFASGADGGDVLYANGGYRSWNGIAGSYGKYIIAPFQGVWVESATTNAQITIPASARDFETEPVFYQREPANEFIRFVAESEDRIWNEAWISFGEDGSESNQMRHAMYMEPLDRHTHLEFVMEQNGLKYSTIHLADHLDNPIVIPVHMKISMDENDFKDDDLIKTVEISWPDVALNEYSKIWIRNLKTGEVTDISETGSIMVTVESFMKSEGKQSLKPSAPQSLKAYGEPVFELVLHPSVKPLSDTSDLPERVTLSQNYPNPFNPATNIDFELPRQTHALLEVYTITGQRAAVLRNETMHAGNHTVTFDATRLASGVYVYRLITPEATLSRKMILIK